MNGISDINRCRVCFKIKSRLLSLYDENDGSTYCKMLKDKLGLFVGEDSNEPRKICSKCIKEFKKIEKFVKKLRRSNDLIRNKSVKSEDDLPLSMFSASMKVKLEEKDDFENSAAEDDIFLEDAEENLQDCDSKCEKLSELINNNYNIINCEKNGVKRNMIQCLTCGLTVQNRSAFLIHNRRHTGEKPCVCKVCDKRFTQSGTLAEHMKRAHPDAELDIHGKHLKRKPEQQYICQYCGKKFIKKNYLTVHIRIHTLEKPYQCTQCPKAFRRCIDFIQHCRIHNGDKPYSCHICARSFVSHTPLKRHLSVHSEERKFKCNICNVAVKSKDSLKKHVIVMHTTDRPNVCHICNATFALTYNLKSHIKAKHSEKSGSCSICKKEYSNIQKHMNTHSAEKSFTCSVCNRKFFTEKGLLAHSSKHNVASTSYACTHNGCSMVFPRQSKLDFHVLKCHTENAPYTCECCSKSFYRFPDLRRHIKSLHPLADCNDVESNVTSVETLVNL